MAHENQDSRLKALDDALKIIEKTYGKGAVMSLGERPRVDCDVIPTGSILLDQALGVGGYPKGRIIEIYGPESSGKTTLALEAIAEAQKKGGRAAFIDAEQSIDPDYAAKLGVNIDELILSQPDSSWRSRPLLRNFPEAPQPCWRVASPPPGAAVTVSTAQEWNRCSRSI